jgi:hypothetical protein
MLRQRRLLSLDGLHGRLASSNADVTQASVNFLAKLSSFGHDIDECEGFMSLCQRPRTRLLLMVGME